MRQGRLIAALLIAAAGWLAPAAVQAAQELNVMRMVLDKTAIDPGARQLLQITLGNTGKRPVRAGLRVEIRDARDRRVGAALTRKVEVPGKDQRRYFFRFRAPRSAGNYTMKFEVYTPDFKKKLIPGGPVFFSPFVVGGARPPARRPAATGQARLTVPSFQPPRGLVFERPDLVWENLSVSPAGLLVGETLRIRVDLRNVGGDIARDVAVRVDYFNTRTPTRTAVISEDVVQVLAPGERLEMEFEAILPDNALLGEYRVALEADVGDKVEESDEANNRLTTAAIRLSQIKLVFPEPGFAFEEAGLFLFRWDSLRFDEFKVQVGANPRFTDRESFFDIPQGGKWTKDKEIVPLEGELPGMAQGLIERSGSESIYWRVMGRDSGSGRTGFSRVSPFVIALAPEIQETQPPGPTPPPAPATTPPPPAPDTRPAAAPPTPPAPGAVVPQG